MKIEQNYDSQTKLLNLTVKQTQNSDKLIPEAFILPLDVEIKTMSGVKIEKIQIKSRKESFSIKLDEEPTAINFDKDEKIPLKLLKMSPLKNDHSDD